MARSPGVDCGSTAVAGSVLRIGRPSYPAPHPCALALLAAVQHVACTYQWDGRIACIARRSCCAVICCAVLYVCASPRVPSHSHDIAFSRESQWVRFDGNMPHMTLSFRGERFTLIFFTLVRPHLASPPLGSVVCVAAPALMRHHSPPAVLPLRSPPSTPRRPRTAPTSPPLASTYRHQGRARWLRTLRRRNA